MAFQDDGASRVSWSSVLGDDFGDVQIEEACPRMSRSFSSSGLTDTKAKVRFDWTRSVWRFAVSNFTLASRGRLE